MTQKEAKELTLELWRYLAEHPEYWEESQIPDDLYERIENLKLKCPLCELFYGKVCRGCPLKDAGEACTEHGSVYDLWSDPDKHEDDRQRAAERIVAIVSAWEPRRNR
jgi:hypothetical protein